MKKNVLLAKKKNNDENTIVFVDKMTSRKQTPSDFLKQIIGRPVVVKLNSGVGN